jgi:hypothetical protein
MRVNPEIRRPLNVGNYLGSASAYVLVLLMSRLPLRRFSCAFLRGYL